MHGAAVSFIVLRFQSFLLHPFTIFITTNMSKPGLYNSDLFGSFCIFLVPYPLISTKAHL